jgi:peptidoglycan L-alanyl-D-glutamate endopeptidase CwlK
MGHALSIRDLQRLDTCHPDIRQVVKSAGGLSPYPFMVVWGWRNEAQQNGMRAKGNSEKAWPDSLHNTLGPDGKPQALAVDLAPIFGGVIPWNDTHIFAVIAGCMFAAATQQRLGIRWGGDWDGDGSTRDQKLMDWGHFELTGR